MSTTFECSLGLSPAALSAWRDQLLPAREAERISTHVRDCEACRVHLAAFERLAQPLRAERAPEPDARLWLAVNAAIARAQRGHGKRSGEVSIDAIKRHRSALVAVAAVILLALGFAELFHAVIPNRVTNGTATPTVSSHTPVVTPSPSPTATSSQGLLVAGQQSWYLLNPATGSLVSSATSPGQNGSPVGPCAVADNGATFVGTASAAAPSKVVAVNVLDGSTRWQHQLPDGQASSVCQMAVANGVVYAPTYPISASASLTLFALSTQDGHELWQVPIPHNAGAAPVISDGVIYLAEYDGVSSQYLYAYRVSDGGEVWHAQFSDGPPPSQARPAIMDGVVYITTQRVYASGTSNFTLHALRARDGSQLWEVAGVKPEDPPAVAAGTVYVNFLDSSGISNQHLVALDAATGTQRWQTSFEMLPVAADAGLVYGYRLDSPSGLGVQLAAVDTANGQIRWQTSYGTDVQVKRLTFTIDNGVIYASWTTMVLAFDAASGRELWRFQGTDEVSPGVLIATKASQ